MRSLGYRQRENGSGRFLATTRVELEAFLINVLNSWVVRKFDGDPTDYSFHCIVRGEVVQRHSVMGVVEHNLLRLE